MYYYIGTLILISILMPVFHQWLFQNLFPTCIPISIFEDFFNCLATASSMIPSSAKAYSTQSIHPSTKLHTRARACSWTEGSGSAEHTESMTTYLVTHQLIRKNRNWQWRSLPQIRLATEDTVNSLKIPSLHILTARNTMFLKANTAFNRKDESIDFVNWISSLTPPHSMNVDFCGVKSITMLLIAPRAATW